MSLQGVSRPLWARCWIARLHACGLLALQGGAHSIGGNALSARVITIQMADGSRRDRRNKEDELGCPSKLTRWLATNTGQRAHTVDMGDLVIKAAISSILRQTLDGSKDHFPA